MTDQSKAPKITAATSYDYTMSGGHAETMATLEDGRKLTVDTQYSWIAPHGDHADDCDQLTKMGGRCTCGLLDDIDTGALIADAREHGLFGSRPLPKIERRTVPTWKSARGLTLTEEMDRDDTQF